MKTVEFIAFASLIAAVTQGAFAGDYQVSITNTLDKELLAPILVALVDADSKIFQNHYVTSEAETQILTGDPAMLAKKIGKQATVAHGIDGPPGVLLGPGKTLSFNLKTNKSAVRIISMVAPTMVPDNFVSAVVNLHTPIDVTLARYDIGHNEGDKQVRHVMGGVAKVTIEHKM